MRKWLGLLFAAGAAVAGLAGAGCGSRGEELPVARAEDDSSRTAERLVAVLDYIASDYGGAVGPDGTILALQEYEEQVSMVASARKLAGELPGFAATAELAALEAAVAAKARPADVAARCASVRARAIEAFRIPTTPPHPPSFARGEAIYKASCVECHGPRGGGDGPRAKKLEPPDPPPANLLDPERMAPVTPYRAYCDVTYGIAKTAMAGFVLPASDRWSVAFYVTALRHFEAIAGLAPTSTSTSTSTVAPRARPLSDVGLGTLASATDAELDALLARTIADPAGRRIELARQRAIAPFDAAAGTKPIAYARAKIDAARAAALQGDRGEADQLVLDAYIRGIEEVEAPLRARAPDVVVRLEDAVARLRSAIARQGDRAVEESAADVLALLDRAEHETEGSPAGAAVLAAMGALLVLREGLEAALIIAAILAVVRRVGLGAAAPRAVHAGWIAALAAGAVTFVLARNVLASLALGRETIEAIVTLLAAAVLFATSFWLISKADATRWLAYVKGRAAGSAAGGGVFGLFTVSFLAAYREAFESVLFFEALMGGVPERAIPLVAGAAGGALALAACVYAIGRLERRLPIGAFFGVSGALLSVLSVVLLGHGIHALQSSSLLLPRPFAVPRIDWLGVYPDAISAGAQGIMLLAIGVAVVAIRLSARSETPRPA